MSYVRICDLLLEASFIIPKIVVVVKSFAQTFYQKTKGSRQNRGYKNSLCLVYNTRHLYLQILS